MSARAPILFIFFRRPDCVARSFAAIRAARPERLYLATDAPRPQVPDDATQCAAARRVVEENLDWPCTVWRDYASTNLGPSRRIESAIDWVFRAEDRAIILEEDCVAGSDFFPFCDALLDHYAPDERVGMISGDQFVPGGWPTPGASYTFAYLAQIWGWATWRRAWAQYDATMADWPEARRQNILRWIFPDYYPHRRYWRRRFDACHADTLDVWDYRWAFARWRQAQKAIVPSHNLVSYVGFRDDALHTRGPHPAAALPVEPLSFPLRHPARLQVDTKLDDATARRLFFEGGYFPWLEYQWKKRILRQR